MVSKYNNFVEDMLLENIVNESILYFSPPLKKVLNRLSHNDDIADELTMINGTEIKPDITFVDIDKEGFFSFTTMKNAKKLINIVYNNEPGAIVRSSDSEILQIDTVPNQTWAKILYDDDKSNDSDSTGVYKKSRNPLRIGRFINRIFPNKFTDKQVEEFVNKFKSTLENTGERFKIVEGDDIAFWYKEDNYVSGCEGSPLFKSCMKDMGEKTFKIYSENPELCRMLILLEDDKLKARAIIWKPTIVGMSRESDLEGSDKFEYFLDRQYTASDSYVHKLRDYAINQGWAFKTLNTPSSLSQVTYKGEELRVTMTIQLKEYDGSFDYNSYPYLDTFRRYDPKTGMMYNDDTKESHAGQYLLDDACGRYNEIKEYEAVSNDEEEYNDEGRVWSEYEGDMIDEDDSVWSEILNDNLVRSSSVQVNYGPRRHQGWYPQGHEHVTYDERNQEWYHIDDTIYSDEYGHSIFMDDSIDCINYVDQYGECNEDGYYIDSDDRNNYTSLSDLSGLVWYDNIKESNRHWEDHSGIMDDLLTKNWDGDWILSRFVVKTFKVSSQENVDEFSGLEYITSIDAEILGIKIDLADNRKTDWWTYSAELLDKNLIDLLLEGARSKVEGHQLRLFELDEEEQKRLNRIQSRFMELQDRRHLP